MAILTEEIHNVSDVFKLKYLPITLSLLLFILALPLSVLLATSAEPKTTATRAQTQTVRPVPTRRPTVPPDIQGVVCTKVQISASSVRITVVDPFTKRTSSIAATNSDIFTLTNQPATVADILLYDSVKQTYQRNQSGAVTATRLTISGRPNGSWSSLCASITPTIAPVLNQQRFSTTPSSYFR